MRPIALSVLIALVFCAPRPASAHEVERRAVLSGANQSPPNGSPGFGDVLITLDLDIINMRVEASFGGLSGPVTGAHIHGRTAVPLTGTAGVAVMDPSLPLFPTGVTAGAYDQTIDLTTGDSYSAAFIAANGGTVGDALNALIFGLEDGNMYFQIDTAAFPNGEVRGFLVPIPEPGSLAMLAGAAGMLALRRRHLPLS